MKKFLLIIMSFLLLACAPLSIINLPTTPNTTSNPVIETPDETKISQFVQQTVDAYSQTMPQLQTQTPTPAGGCAQLLCPTCAAADVNSPIFPAPPTVSVHAGNNQNNSAPKSDEASTPTSTITPTVTPAKPYMVQSSTPIYLTNFAHQDQACNWTGLAGQVFDLNGNPAKNILIIVSGNFNGSVINAIGMTGTTYLYGPGGYEIVLGNKPMASNGTLSVTVYGLDGVPLSDPVSFNTVGDCQKNLALINFKQVR